MVLLHCLSLLITAAPGTTRFEARTSYTSSIVSQVRTFGLSQELELGMRMFLTPLVEDPVRHRRVVELVDHPSYLDLSLTGADGFALTGVFYADRSTAALFQVSTGLSLTRILGARVGLIHHLRPTWRVDADVSARLGLAPYGSFVARAGTSFLLGRWLQRVYFGASGSTFLWAPSDTATVALTFTTVTTSGLFVGWDHQFFATRRLAFALNVGVGFSEPVDTYADDLTGTLPWRSAVSLGATAAVEWEWTDWVSTSLTLAWRWQRAAATLPTYWVGPGFDVRFRF